MTTPETGLRNSLLSSDGPAPVKRGDTTAGTLSAIGAATEEEAEEETAG